MFFYIYFNIILTFYDTYYFPLIYRSSNQTHKATYR